MYVEKIRKLGDLATKRVSHSPDVIYCIKEEVLVIVELQVYAGVP